MKTKKEMEFKGYDSNELFPLVNSIADSMIRNKKFKKAMKNSLYFRMRSDTLLGDIHNLIERGKEELKDSIKEGKGEIKKGVMVSDLNPRSLEAYNNKILVTLRNELRNEMRAIIIEELPNALNMLLANEEE
jgi:septum formation inhibitor MinC